MPQSYHRFPENTLRRIAIDAKKNYAEYKRLNKFEEKYVARYPSEDLSYLQEQFREYSSETPPPVEVEADMQKRLGFTSVNAASNFLQWESKRNLQKAKEHFDEHAGSYHELALIEAHIDGVEINVSDPLIIGREPTEKNPS